jgi:hypothetical protein
MAAAAAAAVMPAGRVGLVAERALRQVSSWLHAACSCDSVSSHLGIIACVRDDFGTGVRYCDVNHQGCVY